MTNRRAAGQGDLSWDWLRPALFSPFLLLTRQEGASFFLQPAHDAR